MFQSFMGSSSEIHIKAAFHKTELAIHVHIKKIKSISLEVGGLLCNGSLVYCVFVDCLDC